jgi:hypothetical protein
MRPLVLTRPAVLLLAAGFLMTVLAGCGKEPPKEEKKKGEPKVTPPLGGTPQPKAAEPPMKMDNGSRPQAEQFNALLTLRKPEQPVDLTRVSDQFLRVIGKPLSRFEHDQKKPYNDFEAREWLLRAANVGFSRDAQVVPAMSGYGRPGVAVFVATYNNPRVPKGRCLVRVVEEGGKDNWKLDWLQVGPVPTTDAAPPATAEDPFKDFAAQAFADLVATPPGNPPEILDRNHRAPLAAALFTKKLLATDPFKANPTPTENEQGYDYDRAMLGGQLDLFLGSGVRVVSYTRTPVANVPDTYRVEFTLDGGTKKTYDLKLVSSVPGRWQVDEVRPV